LVNAEAQFYLLGKTGIRLGDGMQPPVSTPSNEPQETKIDL